MEKLNDKKNKFDKADIPEIEFIEYSLNEEDTSGIGIIDISNKKNKRKYIEDIEEIEDIDDDDIDDYDDYDEDEEEGKLNIKKEILSWIVMLLIAVGIAAFISNFVLINAFIPTGSMENTIPKESRLVGLRLAYTFSEPERGDIIIFKNPNDPNENYVKRIIGLPGEKIQIDVDGNVLINDQEIDQSYLQESEKINTYRSDYIQNMTLTLSNNEYYVMGDHRLVSLDSRIEGPIKEEYILAKLIFTYAQYNNFDSSTHQGDSQTYFPLRFF